ncbi:F0F1 ATP synthase subunit B [Kovacikia minuta CCNUW1]|uniref:F0F1 ATP synthase subunit B n=1 Tax=Kovacikia minuta TaxID=2931930 RepID=UPI001CCD0090|nr:F0F1 ATP synthase subunit B [Kovacikia minuta]UBF27282.1 F0F1 ATP synthase subunit B [Kovacikia minuta CCNUW1]
MGIFLKLAVGASLLGTEAAEAAEEGGFGLNFNILEANLINLAIVIAILIYFGRGFLGKVLTDRRSAIEVAIQEAEKKKKDAAAALADEQQKLAQAQAEAAKIRSSSETAAKSAAAAILAKAEEDIQRMRETAVQDMGRDQERVIRELRQRVVALAVQRAESDLSSRLDQSRQHQLVDQSIASLGGF